MNEKTPSGGSESSPGTSPAGCDSWLKDVRTTTDTEAELVECVATRRTFDAGGRKLSGRFVSDLLIALGNYSKPGSGIDIEHAVITGPVDISGADIDQIVSMKRCEFDDEIRLNFARIRTLFLDGSSVRRLCGVRAQIATSIYLRSSRLRDETADIRRGRIAARSNKRFLNFEAPGGVDLSGSKITGALSARGAMIGFMQQDSECGTPISIPRYALNLADAEIESIILGPKDEPSSDDERGIDRCVVRGGISLQRARCRSFNDDEHLYDGLQHPLVLRGFRYEGLGRLSPKDVEFRRKWLKRDADRDERFDPQPYEQLAKVLRAQGEAHSAHTILIKKNREQLRQKAPETKKASLRSLMYRMGNGLKRLLMEPIGYGYRPHQLIPYMLVIVLAGGIVFNYAYLKGQVAPSSPLVARSPAWLDCKKVAGAAPTLRQIVQPTPDLRICQPALPSSGSTEAQRALHYYPDFNGYWYALDAFLPIVALRQEEFWVPVRQEHVLISWRSFTHSFTLVGWLLSSLGIVGALSYLNRQ